MAVAHVFDGPQWMDPRTGLRLCRRIEGRGFCLKPASDPVHVVAREHLDSFGDQIIALTPEDPLARHVTAVFLDGEPVELSSVRSVDCRRGALTVFAMVPGTRTHRVENGSLAVEERCGQVRLEFSPEGQGRLL